MTRQRGFALLIVLWTLVPLTVLFLTLTGVARSDTRLAANSRDAATLQAAADGGIETAIFRLIQPGGSLAPTRLQLDGAVVEIRIESLSGLVNPNTAQPNLLRAMLIRLGVDQTQADALASAIADWRTPGRVKRPNGAKAPEYRAAGRDYGPPGAPIESLGELRDVLGMTPGLFAAMRPFLSLYTDRPPDPALAPPLVRAALADIGSNRPGGGQLGDVFRITAEARGSAGARVVRTATIRLGSSDTGKAWRVLAWDTATDA